MSFDERKLKRCHVVEAIKQYLREKPEHRPARSAFLLHNGKKLPAKYIIRLAYKIGQGHMPRSEELTGGRAAVRVLCNLNFRAIYDKPPLKTPNKNSVKSARRRAFKLMLEKRFGPFQIERRLQGIAVPDLQNRHTMDPVLRKILVAIERVRHRRVLGSAGYKLAFDLFHPKLRLAIEYDERQHFTRLRASGLKAYPAKLTLGYDRVRWGELCEQVDAGDNDPVYRDEQRAFYDAIRDVLAPRVGLLPVFRVFEEDVKWERVGRGNDEAKRANCILDAISRLVQKCKSDGV